MELKLFNNPEFQGADYQSEKDKVRLTGQIHRIFDCMKDGRWRTFYEIEAITNDPQASISAQLRNLRKDRFGRHTVNKRRTTKNGGTYEYQLIVNQSTNGHTP